MATVITMPRLSPTMEEGVLLKWSKKEGDRIKPGDVIAEVETDKANMDFPLEDEGTLLKLLVKEGETVKLGAPVAVLGEEGEDADAALRESAAPPSGDGAAAAETPTPAEKAAPAAKAAPAPAAPAAKAAPAPAARVAPPAEKAAPAPAEKGAPAPAPATPEATPSAPAGDGGLRASPLARKLATEQGIDLRAVQGSGPGGRVVKRDIDQAAAQPAAAPPSAAPSPAALPSLEERLIPLSPMRRTIARRLTEAKATVPHFYVVRDAIVDALWDFHEQVKQASDEKISLNDLVLKAVATALRRVPEANASFTDAGIARHGRVDIGIAVSIDDGLVTPVLRDADQKPLATIARESRDLIERARARRLKGDEFTGGTFSVSNMGMYGVREFSAVINPPEGGILAVGAIEKRPVVVADLDGNDAIQVARVMTLTLSADHRVVDGALAARLLGEIVRVLEHPVAMVL